MTTPTSRRLTGFGWLTLVLALICLGALALHGVWSPATLGTGLVACIILALWLTPKPLGHLRRRWLLPNSIHAGEPSQLGLEFTAAMGLPPILLSLKPQSRVSVLSWTWLTGLIRGPIRVRWSTQFRRRGWQRVPELQFRCRHPFGLVEARQRHRDDASVLVLPRLGTLNENVTSGLNRWFQDMNSRPRQGDEEFGWLRPYRPGDPPRTVNWKASARLRSLQVTHREGTPSRDLTLWLDIYCRLTQREQFERLVSCAATLVDQLEPEGWRIRLCGDFAPEGKTGNRQQLMELLALLKPTTTPHNLPELSGPTLLLSLDPARFGETGPHVTTLDPRVDITFEENE